METIRNKLLASLSLPDDEFNPWSDVIEGIWNYSSAVDDIFIEALEAVKNKTQLDFLNTKGVAAEIALYSLAANDLIDYGTSPRFGWPNFDIEDLWQQLIDKWKAYYLCTWGEPYREPNHA